MSIIIINGIEEIQQEGLSYKEFIQHYPDCYLRRENDGALLGKSDSLLETGKRYTLIRISG